MRPEQLHRIFHRSVRFTVFVLFHCCLAILGVKAIYQCGYGILCLLFIQTFALSWFILAAVEIEMATCKNPAWAYLLDIHLTYCFVVCERELIKR